MRCTKFTAIISAYVDSEATAFEQLAMQEHIKTCAYCKAELESQYILREMVRESHSFSDNININVSTSVMASIRQKKQNADMDFAAMAQSAAIATKSHNWVAVALMFAITMAAVFSAHRLNSHVAVAEAEPMYSEFVYEHLSSDLSGVYYSDPQIKQVSYTR